MKLSALVCITCSCASNLEAWITRVAPRRDEDLVGHLAVRHSHPRWVVEAFLAALGRDEAECEAALAADNDAPAVTPLAGFAAEPADAEPDVTIRQDGDRTIEEYRLNGVLYAVKITPKHGKPYFLVRAADDGNFVRADQPEMMIPAWEIFRW